MTASTKQKKSAVSVPRDQSIPFAAVAGLVSGVSIWLMTRLIDRFVTQPLLCPSDTAPCTSSTATAFTLALVMGLFLALPVLVRARVYRPLLVILAVAIALWGMQDFLQYLRWYEASLWLGVCMALAFAAFAWLARTQQFYWALIGLFSAVVFARTLLFLL